MSIFTEIKSPLILTGAYGSGKTECALALATLLAQDGPVTLIDMDFVTPYFRAQDLKGELAAQNVTVISPDIRNAAIDSPSIPPEAAEHILRPQQQTVIDLGGDPTGAVVMGQYAPYLQHYDMWAVVNFSRPTTPTPEIAAELLREIMQQTRLQLTGIVSNTHLGEFTTEEDVLDGLADARQLAAILAVPLKLLCLSPHILYSGSDIPTLPITPRLLRPWE
ncbi:MAG: hypothetical protein WCJ56_15320 [bacterium]